MVRNTKNQNKFIEEAIIMKEQTSSVQNTGGLKPHLSSLAVWALSVGSAIGWGSLVVTSSSYLSEAGPLASVLGLLVGAAFCHNFGLASSGEGPTANGKVAVIICIVVLALIGVVNSRKKEA